MEENKILSDFYDEFFGAGYWEEQYKPHIIKFVEQYVAAQFKQQAQSAGVWVKASERLPKDKEPRSLKNHKLREYDTEELITEENVKFLSDGIEITRAGRFYTILHKNLEWLDESQQSQPQSSLTDEDWINADIEPEMEGRYLAGHLYKDGSFYEFVSNFKYFTNNQTKQRIIDSDGFKGCWVGENGYGMDVTHWRKLPNPPKAALINRQQD